MCRWPDAHLVSGPNYALLEVTLLVGFKHSDSDGKALDVGSGGGCQYILWVRAGAGWLTYRK